MQGQSDSIKASADNGFSLSIIDGVSINFADQIFIPNNKKLIALATIFEFSDCNDLQRELIVSLLWSDSAEDKAKASLRNLLYLQKDVFPKTGERLFESRRDVISRIGNRDASDIERLIAAIETNDGEQLETVRFKAFEGRLFRGLDGIDPAFDEWLMQTRLGLCVKIAQRMSSQLREESPSEDYRLIATKLAEMQPDNEVACRYLMRLDTAKGNISAALKRYEALWQHLDEDYDIEPSAQTADLVVALKTATLENRPVVEARSNELRTTIFVRGFSSGNIDDAEFFVRGIHAELLNALFAVDDWVIVEPDEGALPEAGSGFFELKGAVAPGLGKVRLILTLKDLANGRIIWNESIPIDVSGWAKNSALAVMRLAALLIDTVEANRFQQVERLSDDDLTDYDRMMRARVLMYDWDMEKDRQAEALFRSILDSDALHIQAKVGLVELLNSRHLVFPGIPHSQNERTEALDLARLSRADGARRPDVALVHGWSALQAGQTDEAIEAATLAAEGSLSNPRRLASAAECMSLAGAVTEGLEYAATSEDLDLGSNRLSHGYRVSVHYAASDHQKCIAAASRASGAIVLGYGYAAAAAHEAGDAEQAQALWQKFCTETRARWCGDGTPSDAELAAWLVKASPLAVNDTRERFEESINRLSND